MRRSEKGRSTGQRSASGDELTLPWPRARAWRPWREALRAALQTQTSRFDRNRERAACAPRVRAGVQRHHAAAQAGQCIWRICAFLEHAAARLRLAVFRLYLVVFHAPAPSRSLVELPRRLRLVAHAAHSSRVSVRTGGKQKAGRTEGGEVSCPGGPTQENAAGREYTVNARESYLW